MKTTHTFAYSWNKLEKADWNCTGLWPVSSHHSGVCPSLKRAPTPAPVALWHSSTLGQGLLELRGALSCKEWSRFGPRRASEGGGGSHYWHLVRQFIRNGPELWLELEPPQSKPQSKPRAHFSCYCSNTAPLWGEDARAERQESTSLEGTEPTQTQTSGLLLHQLGTHSHS